MLASWAAWSLPRVAYPSQYLIVEMQPARKFGELLLKHFLAHIFVMAACGVALALVSMTRAVIVKGVLLIKFLSFLFFNLS
jgi:hypothetical protein